jgi:hypothetical protein
MKKAFVIFSAVTFLTLLLISQVTSQTTATAKPRTLYKAYIDELILKCDSKAARYNSRCQNIRRDAELYRLKAEFYRTNKVQLIKDMVQEDVGIKPYQMHYYLNHRFFDAQLHH